MENVSFQISIDGVTPNFNYVKSHNAKITEKVIQSIEECPIWLITESNYNVFEKQKDDKVLREKHIFNDNRL